ncbi:MAG: AAA family ATPase, partial [Patescibacteria group bacterium]
GAISGVTVVDVENGGSTEGLPETLTAKSGGGGRHLFYRYQPGMQNKTRIRELTDIRSDGGYCLLSPSYTEKGNYEWLNTNDLAPFPAKLFEGELAQKTDWQSIAAQGALEGERNDSLTRIFGGLFRAFNSEPELWESTIWEFGKFVNSQKNNPPLSEKEIRTVYESILSRQGQGENTERNKREWKCEPILLSSLMKKEFENKKWIIERLVPRDGIVAISGFPGCFKTWVILDLILKVAIGEKFLGRFETDQSPVLFIDEENGEKLIQERVGLLGYKDDLPIYLASYSDFIINPKNVEKTINFCLEKNIKLVVFDSLIRIHTGNENDAGEMATVLNGLKQLAKNGITVIFTHHNRKPSGNNRGDSAHEMRGSSDIRAAVNSHLAINSKEAEGFIEIKQTKLRDAEALKPFRVTINKADKKIALVYADEIDETATKVEEIKEIIPEIIKGSESNLSKTQLIKEIMDQIPAGKTTIKTAIKEMEKAGVLIPQKGAQNTMNYLLKEDESKSLEPKEDNSLTHTSE